MANSERQRLWPIAILIIATILAYSNTFTAPFIFDDSINILENPSIKKLWPLWTPLQVPSFTGIVGRPVVNVSLAVNYFISGGHVWSYHAFNLIIHLLCAWSLFAVIRRTAAFMTVDTACSAMMPLYAFSCALLWALHPLTTQAVTYVVQRCESMAALFVLLTLYSAIRHWQTGSGNRWQYLAVFFFLLALGTKESAAIIPVLIVLYEWIFRGYKPSRAFRTSPLLYAGLFMGIMTAVAVTMLNNTLALRTANRAFPVLNYWITQADVIIHYFRLSLWPTGQVIDYGWPASTFAASWSAVIAVLIVMALCLRQIWRKKPVGFLGGSFFLLLAPSSLIPLPDIAFEHRMYLPLAAVICLVTALLCKALVWGSNLPAGGAAHRWISSQQSMIMLVICLGLVLGFMTYQRNRIYCSEVSLWNDTIEKRPGNFRGYHGVGLALSKEGHFAQGLAYLRQAQLLSERNAYVRNDIGFLLFKLNRVHEAIPYFREAIQLKQNNIKAYNNLGAALAQTGQLSEALQYFEKALALNPDDESARNNLRTALGAFKREKGQ